jgi:hypothetical protein
MWPVPLQNAVMASVAAQPPADLKAVQAWEHHIEHHDVHRVLADAVQRRLTGAGSGHLVAEAAQGQLEALPGSRVVLD